MSDIKLFNISGVVTEYHSSNVSLEKELQTTIESNMFIFFGVKFLASEYKTTDGGRMDSIGIDENHCPVIFEYKRSIKENVINQGLFYLNWLLEHKDSFKILVLEAFGKHEANNIDWSMPRLICIAGDFTKYDSSAIKQINRNISLIRYKKFSDELLMFEQINENTINPIDLSIHTKQSKDKTFAEKYSNANQSTKLLYDNIESYILTLGDDISKNNLKLYTAFKKIKNFICIEIFTDKILLHISLDPSTVSFENGFSRDTSNIGHWGTGNVEITIKSDIDFQKAKKFIDRAYNEI